MNKLITKGILILSLFSLVALSGCGAIHTSVAKKELDVQTKMSQSIFLDPVAPEKRVVYVRVRNTSDKPNLNVEQAIKRAIRANGYRITDNPEEAHYWLQANILKAGRADKREDKSGVSGAITGGAIGSTMGSGDGKTAMVVAGALLGTMLDASVKDIYYTIITDIRISERTKDNVVVTETDRSTLTQGTAGTKTVSSVEDVNWKRYQTRIVSVANKVNLTFDEAEPALINGLVQSISNMF